MPQGSEILIVRLRSLGDLVLETPAIAALHAWRPDLRISVLAEPRFLSCPADMHQNELAEMFDKYNLHALPVVDAQSRMVGVVQADHVIAFLREKL